MPLHKQGCGVTGMVVLYKPCGQSAAASPKPDITSETSTQAL